MDKPGSPGGLPANQAGKKNKNTQRIKTPVRFVSNSWFLLFPSTTDSHEFSLKNWLQKKLSCSEKAPVYDFW